MYFPPNREALCPSLGWPRRDEGGPWALAEGRHSEGQSGGERVRGGITVLWMETSCNADGWVVTGMVGVATTTPLPVPGLLAVCSRGFTLDGMMGWMEVSGARLTRAAGLVVSNIFRTWLDWNWSVEFLPLHLERLKCSLLFLSLLSQEQRIKCINSTTSGTFEMNSWKKYGHQWHNHVIFITISQSVHSQLPVFSELWPHIVTSYLITYSQLSFLPRTVSNLTWGSNNEQSPQMVTSRWQQLWGWCVWPAADIVSDQPPLPPRLQPSSCFPGIDCAAPAQGQHTSWYYTRSEDYWGWTLTIWSLTLHNLQIYYCFTLKLRCQKLFPALNYLTRPFETGCGLWTTRCDYCPTNFSTVVLRVIAVKHISEYIISPWICLRGCWWTIEDSLLLFQLSVTG